MENEIYKFLKENNLTQKDEKSFLEEYSTPEKAKELHGFMSENKLTSKTDAEFYDQYFKKKDTAQPTNESSQPLQQGTEGSAMPSTESTNFDVFGQTGVGRGTTLNLQQTEDGELGYQSKDVVIEPKKEEVAPYDFRPEAEGFIDAIKRGSARYIDIDLGKDPINAKDIIRTATESEKFKGSKAYQDFNEAKGVKESLKQFAKNPIEISSQLMGESLTQLGRTFFNKKQAAETAALMGGGAAVGSVAGVGAGFLAANTLAGMKMEYSNAYLEAMREAGVDLTDEKSIEEFLADDTKKAQAREYAYKRGVPIAIANLFGAKLGGTIAGKAGKTVASKVGAGTGALAAETLSEGGGEAAAQLASKGQLEPKEILTEMIAGVPSGVADITASTIALNKKNRKGSDYAKTKQTPQEFSDAIDFEEGVGTLTEQEASDIKKEYGAAKKADKKIPVDAPNREQLVDAETQLTVLNDKLKDASELDAPFIQDDIRSVTQSVAIPLPPKYLDTAGKNTSELKDGQLYITKDGRKATWDATKENFVYVEGKKKTADVSVVMNKIYELNQARKYASDERKIEIDKEIEALRASIENKTEEVTTQTEDAKPKEAKVEVGTEVDIEKRRKEELDQNRDLLFPIIENPDRQDLALMDKRKKQNEDFAKKREEINAKYDAELAALKPTEPTTQPTNEVSPPSIDNGEAAVVETPKVEASSAGVGGDVKLENGNKIQWNVFGNEESGEWTVGEKTKTRGGKDAVVLTKVYVEASSDGKSYTKEYADANGIKYDNERVVEHIVPLEDLQSQKETPKAETSTETVATEPAPVTEQPIAEEVVAGRSNAVPYKSDADIEKRMSEIQNANVSFDSAEQKEFNALEKEMEKRERESVFNTPLENVNAAIDALIQKEKDMPNGYGSFIEKRDARETKEVADRYLNAKELTDSELKKDFSDAVRGNPTTWYADGLKLRESLREATSRGIDTDKMLLDVIKVYENAGYDTETAKSVVGNMLKPILQGVETTTENNAIQQLLPQPTEPVATEPESGKVASELRDVESVAKALVGVDLPNIFVSEDKGGILNRENYYRIAQEKFQESKGLTTEEIFDKNKQKEQFKTEKGRLAFQKEFEKFAENADNKKKILAEAYHKAKANGSNPELVKAVEELLGTETKPQSIQEEVSITTEPESGKEQGVSAVQEPRAEIESEVVAEQQDQAAEPTEQKQSDVTFEEKPTEMPDGEDGIELFVTMPDGKTKSAGKFYPEDTKDIAKVKRGYELQAKKARIDSAIQLEKDKLKNLLKEGDNLGIALDPEREAKRQFQIHKTILTLAKLYIQKGVQSAVDFATEVGLRVQDVQRAWDEATGGNKTTEKDIEKQPYDVDYIKNNLLNTPQQPTAQTNLEVDAVSAIGSGAVNFQQFQNAMAANPNFSALPKQSQQSLYFTAVSQFTNQQAVNQQAIPSTTINLKEQGFWEKVKFNFQDRLARLKDVQQQMTQAGIQIYDDANAALKYELLIGKARTKIQDKYEKIVKSKDKGNPALLEKLIADGGDPDELGIYMYALHAEERNTSVANERQQEFDEAVKVLNDKIANAANQSVATRFQNELTELVAGRGKVKLLSDGGSGMTNQQAADIIKAVDDSGKKDLYDKYARQFRDEVIVPNLNNLLEYGLITQEQYDVLATKYTNYVPLQVVEKALAKRVGSPMQRGGVQGKDIFKAKGSSFYKFTERYNPLMSSMFAFNNTVIRGEKNTAAGALVNLAQLDTDKEVFEILKPKYTPILNSNGDVDYIIDATPQFVLDNSIRVMQDGKPTFVNIKDKALMDAFKELGENRSIRQFQMVNSWLRNVATLMNPEFLFTNFSRDFETALINIQSEIKDFDVKGATRFIANPKNIFLAGQGLVKDYNGNHNSEWAKTAREYRENGGQVSWFQRETLDEFVKDVNKDISKIQKGTPLPARLINSVAETFFLAQSTVEQSLRLSTYKALRDRGVSAEQAALAAKNITVNFETKGKYGAMIDSLYLFANAGIQGSYRMLKSLAKSRKAQAAAGALYAVGLSEAFLNDMLGGEDDEDEQISDAIKERNFVLVNPTDPKKPYFKFPLAYGANVFKYLGNLTYDVANDRKQITQASADAFLAIYNQFSPIQGATIAQALSPTALDPIVQAMENKSFFNTPLYPETNKYAPPKKDSDLYFSSVRPQTKWIAQWLNNNTGGTDVAAGKIDVSPEILDHFYDAITGGTGRFIANVGALGYAGYKYGEAKAQNRPFEEKDNIALRNVPFLRAFVGDTNEKRSMEAIYDIFERSSKELLSDKEVAKFNKEMDLALKSQRMDGTQAKRMRTMFTKGQNGVRVSLKQNILESQSNSRGGQRSATGRSARTRTDKRTP